MSEHTDAWLRISERLDDATQHDGVSIGHKTLMWEAAARIRELEARVDADCEELIAKSDNLSQAWYETGELKARVAELEGDKAAAIAHSKEVQRRYDATTARVAELEGQDNPEFDGTDFAHPAWWRGHDQSSRQAAQIIVDAATSEKHDRGSAHPEWQKALDTIIKLRKKAEENKRDPRGD